ncbi:Putative 5-formyltetrahydrofolate cyclo-ligase, nagB/RpiA transferase [Septoria linicola]|uniref:5-formyltetrahydrofolate cyclo-ligase n=1 Tax=Septoria linicola TaxID=215465 RepID=A0A9Q9AY93_9PEZI|nr:Putative 5-formyltetrahydrofolate cyclo-ligase, nagB/RpiA transferase [Septoria linicola]
MTSEAKQAKKELRSLMKQKLSGLSEQDVLTQSRRAQNLILNSPQYQSAKRVGIYLSMPQSEAQTDSLVVDALWAGKKVFVPYIYSVQSTENQTKRSKVMDMMRIESMIEYGELEKDSWGIPKLEDEGIEERENAVGGSGLSFKPDGSEVEMDASEGGLDLIVVPAVAFDRRLNRMGHGAGFYDKLLARHWGDGRRKKPHLTGLCLAEQILPDGKLVMEPWDWRVDAVAVGDGKMLTLNATQ